MAMLWMFHTLWRGDIVIAHLDHQLRGREGRQDAEFVQEVGNRLNIPVRTASLPVPELLQAGESFEDGARRIRYGFLEEVRASVNGWGVGVAHTSDDEVETFLLNLLRGSGPRGLAGIPERRGRVFRPLLVFSRDFLRATLRHHGIPWREDRTNEDTLYLRNRVRNRLLPLLREEYNPRAKEHILGTAQQLKGIRDREESTWSTLVELGRRRIPAAAYACPQEFLRGLAEADLCVFFRGVARELGLAALPRKRLFELASLARRSSGWCFQWQKECFLFSSSGFVSWVDPAILNRSAPDILEVPLNGTAGCFQWGQWFFSWKLGRTSEYRLGAMRAVLPGDSALSILPASEGVPSWGSPVFPVVQSGSLQWTPFWQAKERVAAPERAVHTVEITATYGKYEGDEEEHGLRRLGSTDSLGSDCR